VFLLKPYKAGPTGVLDPKETLGILSYLVFTVTTHINIIIVVIHIVTIKGY
jgi:hypothetical protein